MAALGWYYVVSLGGATCQTFTGPFGGQKFQINMPHGMFSLGNVIMLTSC
jgi:hypothetical protein